MVISLAARRGRHKLCFFFLRSKRAGAKIDTVDANFILKCSCRFVHAHYIMRSFYSLGSGLMSLSLVTHFERNPSSSDACLRLHQGQQPHLFTTDRCKSRMLYNCHTCLLLMSVSSPYVGEKVQVGKDQEKAQSEKDSHFKNRGGKKTKLTIRYFIHIVRRMSSYFPNRWPLRYLNLTKNMKTYIRRQQHKKI